MDSDTLRIAIEHIHQVTGAVLRGEIPQLGSGEPTPSAYLVRAAWLSVRAGAGVWHERLGYAAFGQRVLVYEQKDGWGRIPFKGTFGWINLSWVRAEQ